MSFHLNAHPPSLYWKLGLHSRTSLGGMAGFTLFHKIAPSIKGERKNAIVGAKTSGKFSCSRITERIAAKVSVELCEKS